MRAVRKIILNKFQRQKKTNSIWEDIVDPVAAPLIIPNSRFVVPILYCIAEQRENKHKKYLQFSRLQLNLI